MYLKKAFVVSIFSLFLIHGIAVAQIQTKAIPQFHETTENARIKGTEDLPPLQLPFWDDFSMSNDLIDTLWANINCVTVNNFIGIDAPTINVATFNGVDASGRPYSSTPGFGSTDSLESRPIDLGSLTQGQTQSLYFSFFWQAKGLGDKPNPTDSLHLQFKSNKGKWYTQWSMVNDNIQKETKFHQEIMLVKNPGNTVFAPDETFFHDSFQFRFQSFGNRGGDYDNWHIDYIYLNHGRHALDTTYQDEALTTPPSSLFYPYYSIPYKTLLQYPEEYLAKPKIQYRNLTAIVPTPKLHAVVNVLDNGRYVFLDSLLGEWTISDPSFPYPGEIRWLDRINALKPEKLASFPDSIQLTLETKVYITSNDPIYDRMNLRSNDTVRIYTHLHNFYAYDDGTAETSLGIDRQGGRLAYMYVIQGQDTITDIDIYFPSFSLTSPSSTIKLQVWDNLSTLKPIYQETYPVQHSSKLNELNRYPLSRPIIVSDTFYIGYEQNVNQFLSVGYDRNTDSSDKLYYYVDLNQGWIPYNDRENPSANVIPGSLMMRPVFGEANVTSVRRPWREPNLIDINIYPNPSDGLINIAGDISEPIIKVMDAYGRVLLTTSSLNIDLQNYPAGIYFITITTRQESHSRKIILRK
jgi:hypothetical protein